MAVLLLCASLLGACSQSSQGTKTSQTSKSSASATSQQKKESKASSSSSEEKKVDYSLYDKVISDYGQVLNGGDVNTLGLNAIASQAYYNSSFYTSIDYAQYDFDKNGTNELVVALTSSDGHHYLLDIYTIADGKLVRLTNKDNRLDSIGERMTITPLSDGSLLYRGSASATDHGYILYKLNSAGNALKKVKEGAEVADLGSIASELSPSDLSWKSVSTGGAKESSTEAGSSTADSSQAKASTPASTGMDIAAIQNGDFSSIAGTWQNGKGYTYTFDSNGLVSDKTYVNLARATVENGILKAYEDPTSPGPGGAMIYFIPKGVSLPDAVIGDQTFVDASDASRDRVYVTQNDANQAMNDYFMYKAD